MKWLKKLFDTGSNGNSVEDNRQEPTRVTISSPEIDMRRNSVSYISIHSMSGEDPDVFKGKIEAIRDDIGAHGVEVSVGPYHRNKGQPFNLGFEAINFTRGEGARIKKGAIIWPENLQKLVTALIAEELIKTDKTIIAQADLVNASLLEQKNNLKNEEPDIGSPR